jgi:hypothetical protein
VVKLNKYGLVLKKNYVLIFILILYFVFGLFLLNYYQYILNSDGISYISIAQKYMGGDFGNAINGYWGPLLSWLMIPFLYFSSNTLSNLYMTKILSLIIGLFTIIGVKLLCDKFRIDGLVQTIFLFSLVPIMLLFSFTVLSPDLLIVSFMVFYLSFIFDDKYSINLKNGFFCGLLGGMAFLSKSYAFVFFILHFTLFNLVFYFQNISSENKKVVFKNFLLGLMVFFMISGTWIALISDKYSELTIGSAGKYNYELVGPESQGHSLYYQGLIKPPNNSAISSWEDPSYFNMESWSPLSSWNNLEYQLKLIWSNFLNIINILTKYSIFSILILIVSIIFIIKTPSKTFKKKVIYSLVTILLYSGLYSFILVENRYLWLVYLLIMMIGIIMINCYYKLDKLNSLGRYILLILLITSFVISPVQILASNLNFEKNIYDVSQILHDDDVSGRIASNEKWEITLLLVYFLNSKYYGTTINNNDINSVNNQLMTNEIDYYLVWDDNNDYQSLDYKEITDDRIPGLKIYSRTNS